MSRLSLTVKKLARYKGKILVMDKFRPLVQSVMGDGYTDQKMYKLTYQLKKKGYLLGLKKDIFLVKDPSDLSTEQDVVDQFYWPLLKKHMSQYIGSKCYIGGIKALEIHMMNYSIPEDILVVCDDKQSTEVVMCDHKVMCKRYTVDGQSLFDDFYRLSVKCKIGASVFRLASVELAILESLYNPNLVQQGHIHMMIKRTMKLYHKKFDYGIVEKVLALGKHQVSVERLCLLIGKQYKGCVEKLQELMRRYSY